MFQRLTSRNALLRIVYEDLAEQIEEQLIETVRGWNDVFQPLHAADEFPRLSRRVRERVCQMTVLEESRGRVPIVSLVCTAHLLNKSLVDSVSSHGLQWISRWLLGAFIACHLPPSWRDARNNRESEIMRPLSSTRPEYSQATRGQ